MSDRVKIMSVTALISAAIAVIAWVFLAWPTVAVWIVLAGFAAVVVLIIFVLVEESTDWRWHK